MLLTFRNNNPGKNRMRASAPLTFLAVGEGSEAKADQSPLRNSIRFAVTSASVRPVILATSEVWPNCRPAPID